MFRVIIFALISFFFSLSGYIGGQPFVYISLRTKHRDKLRHDPRSQRVKGDDRERSERSENGSGGEKQTEVGTFKRQSDVEETTLMEYNLKQGNY